MTIASDVTELIGHTPMVRLSRFGCGAGSGGPDDATIIRGEVLAKLEARNPGGSVKDRTALYMIKDAELRGLLKPGGAIVEPTSGNTGVGLAMIAAVRGYRLVLTMPDSMSVERRKLLAAYGAEIVLTPGALGMAGAVEEACSLQREHPDWFMPSQFENPSNPRAHEETTASEIIADLGGALDAFVAGIGTGGTITGVGGVLNPWRTHSRRRTGRIRSVVGRSGRTPWHSGDRGGLRSKGARHECIGRDYSCEVGGCACCRPRARPIRRDPGRRVVRRCRRWGAASRATPWAWCARAGALS